MVRRGRGGGRGGGGGKGRAAKERAAVISSRGVSPFALAPASLLPPPLPRLTRHPRSPFRPHPRTRPGDQKISDVLVSFPTPSGQHPAAGARARARLAQNSTAPKSQSGSAAWTTPRSFASAPASSLWRMAIARRVPASCEGPRRRYALRNCDPFTPLSPLPPRPTSPSHRPFTVLFVAPCAAAPLPGGVRRRR
ncbi:MAG: hypothetical protein BJ554DRAFT_5673 [Olpidium bornovanus]|uniref:Uncharacterized protein n=1 Tax=Olpidium bornovanus TaxID=278681 RepID=A0A8H7ZZ14_9FUNG|nr:MAG: hypothetical protein BJ554DRAFT_5673 [Olpidium bornovanus]